MKKIFLSLLIIISLMLTLCACGNPLNSMKSDILDKKNYTVETTLHDVPLFGSVITTIKYDGDLSYTMSLGIESYSSIEDGTHYKYTQNYKDEWVKSVVTTDTTTDSTELDEEDLEILFDINNYVKTGKNGDETLYKMKADVTLEKCSNVTLSLSKSTASFSMTLNSSGFSYLCDMNFKAIGSTTVTLPEVTE